MMVSVVASSPCRRHTGEQATASGCAEPDPAAGQPGQAGAVLRLLWAS